MLSNDLLADQLTLLERLTREVKDDKIRYMEERREKLKRIDQIKDSILYLTRITGEGKKK